MQIANTKRTKFTSEGIDCPVNYQQERSWMYLNFYQQEFFICGHIPRVTPLNGKAKLVAAPWAIPRSSFTLLFEYNVLKLILKGISTSSAGRHMGISGNRVFRNRKRHVGEALCDQGLSPVKAPSVDETSTRKGHLYLTLLTDRQTKKLVDITPEKSQNAFFQALVAVEVRGAGRESVRFVTKDISKSYIEGVTKAMPQADIVFARSYIAKQLDEVKDETRRQESRQYNESKDSQYLWLRNNVSSIARQRKKDDILEEDYPTYGYAYKLRELFKQVINKAQVSIRIQPLNNCIKAALASGLRSVQDFIYMLVHVGLASKRI